MLNRRVNNKSITVQSFHGQFDFSLALQISIHDEDAVAELVSRRDNIYEQCKQYGDIREDSSNFHITICLSYPKIDNKQLEGVSAVLQYLNDKYADQTFDLALADKNEIFGHQHGNKFSVAIIEKTQQLSEFYNDLFHQLTLHGIKVQQFSEGFNPHVSLFICGVDVQSDALNSCVNKRVNFSLSGKLFEFSHKNNENKFVVINQNDLEEMRNWLPSVTKNNFTLHHVASDTDSLLKKPVAEPETPCMGCNVF